MFLKYEINFQNVKQIKDVSSKGPQTVSYEVKHILSQQFSCSTPRFFLKIQETAQWPFTEEQDN